jgi:hypothetical protein
MSLRNGDSLDGARCTTEAGRVVELDGINTRLIAQTQDKAADTAVRPVVILIATVGRGRFRASFDGRVLVEASSTPFLDAARVLAGEGVDPATRIVMRHEGKDYDALTSTVAAAAKLTVKESTSDGKPRFGDWHPYGGPGVPVAPPMSKTDPAAIPVAPTVPAFLRAMHGDAG